MKQVSFESLLQYIIDEGVSNSGLDRWAEHMIVWFFITSV